MNICLFLIKQSTIVLWGCEVLACPESIAQVENNNNTTTTTVLRPFVLHEVSRYQKKHSPTHHPDCHPIFISFFHLPRSIASSLFKLRAWQSFCTISFHVLLVWSPPPHIPYISSPSQCLLFAAHAHTIATCFAVVSILYYLFLVFILTPYLELCVLP